LQGSTGTAGVVGATGALLPLNTAGSSTVGYILGKNANAAGWSGTIYVSSAFFQNGVLYQGSDERWKNFIGDVDVNLDSLKSIPKKYYTWKEDTDGSTQIGTSAQKLYEMFPEIVSVGEDGFMSVAYDRLSIIALAAIDKLVEENEDLKSRIEKLEKK
jgi:hypothetical protein